MSLGELGEFGLIGCSHRARARARSLADGATLDDLGFGEDYELLATTPDPGDLAVIGRVEEGEGVELTLAGRPCRLSGWDHFRC